MKGCLPVAVAVGLLAAGTVATVPERACAAGKAVCSQFRTCEEAKKALKEGATGIDGDNDGIPCERTLCRT
ncbi:excalibur calcium-binding domain-containing protein [Vulcanococcus limneticus]|uniref:excalibur calcium-binding domain-containing protein n=1 Tax=Vulcanococcus limneticus TaxID=2170428 RepID=UPI00398BC7F6